MNSTISVLRGHQFMFRKYPDVVDVEEMREMLGGIGRRTAYQLLKDKKIESVKIGRTYRIPKICVISYLCNSSEIENQRNILPSK